MKKRWGSVKQEVYQVLAATEMEGRLPDRFEAARLESRLHDFIATLSRQNDQSSAKTTEVASSSANDEAYDLADFGATEENDVEIGLSVFTEETEHGRKVKVPSTASVSKCNPRNAMRPVPKSVPPLANESSRVALVSVRPSVEIAVSSSDDQKSVSTEPQFVPDNNTILPDTDPSSSAVTISLDCDADREIWQVYLRYNDPDQPYTTKLPSLGAPGGVATSLCKKHNLTLRLLHLRLQRLWRVHHQSRAACQENYSSTSTPTGTQAAPHPVNATEPSTAAKTPFPSATPDDIVIWQTYLKYNDPDAPLTTNQPSFNAPHGALVQVRKQLNLNKGQLLKRLVYLWYQYQQHRASASVQNTHAAVAETGVSVAAPPVAPTIALHCAESQQPPAPSAPLSQTVPSTALFTAEENTSLWQAFMKQRQFRRLPPRRVDNIVGENLLSVLFVTEQARRLGRTYNAVRAHLKRMIFEKQAPKTTFSAQEDDYIWSTFQEHKQLDTVLRAEAARKLSEMYQCKPEMVVERLQTLTVQRSVSSDGAEVEGIAPEPVPRAPPGPLPVTAKRAHVPTPHSATTNINTELPAVPAGSACNGAAYLAEALAAKLDAETPPVSSQQPTSRYVTRSRVPSCSRALQEANDQIWAAYSPYDSPAGTHLNALPRNFLPDLANRLNMPSSAVKERLRGLILEHHPPPPPSATVVGGADSIIVKSGVTATSTPLVAKRKRRRRDNGDKAQKRQARTQVTLSPLASATGEDVPGPVPDTPHEPMVGLMAALAEAATSFVASQEEPQNDGSKGARSEDEPDGDMISILTASSEVSDIDEQDSKLHSVLSTRFTYTPAPKVTRACVSTATTTPVQPPASPFCSEDAHVPAPVNHTVRSLPSLSLHSTADSSASEVSSVTTDAPFPLPFSAREDAYLWGMIQPGSSHHQSQSDVYERAQQKLHRSYGEVKARMRELMQQKLREVED